MGDYGKERKKLGCYSKAFLIPPGVIALAVHTIRGDIDGCRSTMRPDTRGYKEGGIPPADT